MKRLIPILIIFSLLLSLCACNGNYAKVDLKKPVSIPEDGIIEKEMLSQIMMKMRSLRLQPNRENSATNGRFSEVILPRCVT